MHGIRESQLARYQWRSLMELDRCCRECRVVDRLAEDDHDDRIEGHIPLVRRRAGADNDRPLDGRDEH